MRNLKNQQSSNSNIKSDRKPYGPVSEFYQFPLALLEVLQVAETLDADNSLKLKTIATSMLNMISGFPGELSALSRQSGNVTAGVFAAADHLNLIVKRQLDYLTVTGVMGTHGFVNTLEILILEFRIWQRATDSNYSAVCELWQAVLHRHLWPPEILQKLSSIGTEQRMKIEFDRVLEKEKS